MIIILLNLLLPVISLGIYFAMSKFLIRFPWFKAMGFVGRYAFVWGGMSLIVSRSMMSVFWVAAVLLYGCSKAYGWETVKANIIKAFVTAKDKVTEVIEHR